MRLLYCLLLGTSLLSGLVPASSQAGPGASGGGDAIAAQFAQVAQRAGDAIESICFAAIRENNPDAKIRDACSHGLGLLDGGIWPMVIRPRTRNTVTDGYFGRAIDAKVDKHWWVLLDVDRWSDLENETDPTKMQAARRKQVTLALHMPLILVEQETLKNTAISDELVNLLITNGVSLDDLVDGPGTGHPTSANKSGVATNGNPGAVAAQFRGVALRAYDALISICSAIKKNPSDPRNSDPNTVVCDLPAYPLFKVEPKDRGSILGSDGRPRDAGNNGADTVYVDVDRWLDLQNKTDLKQIRIARIDQVTLALHETFVIDHQELDDVYLVSDQAVNLLMSNAVNFEDLIGSP